MTKPIKPSDVVSVRKPDQVFEIFNELITKKWDGVQAKITAHEAAEAIAERMDITKSDTFTKKYLDIEESYKQQGWNVIYYKPGYNENPYDPFFIFSKKDID